MYNQQLETFIAVADAGSFSKAGERLYITSTAVIKQINTLEKRMQVRLFDRSNKGVTLTRAGESFYKDAKHILQYMDDSVQRATGHGFGGGCHPHRNVPDDACPGPSRPVAFPS